MKIGLLIGRLGQGGAEHQLMQLATGLVRQGHQVEVLCYRGSSAMDHQLEEHGITVRNVPAKGRWGHVALTQRWLDDFAPQIVHAFMNRASCVAVLARLRQSEGWRTTCCVIASDYSNASYERYKPSLWVSLCLFGLADQVVTETQMNQHQLERLAPWLKGRVNIIRNGLDLSRFRPASSLQASRDTSQQSASLHFCALGTVYEVKNPERVVEAVSILYQRRGEVFRLDWYGRLSLAGDQIPSLAYQRSLELADALGVTHLVTFHGSTADVEGALRRADVYLHASLREGFPNALAEAMAMGLPVLVSRVSDLPLVVEHADNGEVFDETDPAAIADSMERMLDMSDAKRRQCGERSRVLAGEWFGEQRFIDEHLRMYTQLMETRHEA